MVQTVVPCSKETYVQTLQRFWKDRFTNQRVSGVINFHGNIASQTTPEANTVYINGEEGNTIYMPEGSILTGTLTGTAVTPDGAMSVAAFVLEAERVVGGNVTATLTPKSDGTPATAAGTFSVAADTTLQAVLLQFTPVASKPVAVKARLDVEGAAMGASTLLPTHVAAGN
jgi:hypothetical protein